MVITLTMLKLLETDATGSTPRTSYEEDEEGSDSERLQSAFINAGIVILIMFVSLIAIAVFYRLGWVRAILGYMMVSTFILYGMLGSIWLYELCWNLRIPLDWLTFTFCIVNFSVGGVLALFSYCPPYVTRAYLIITSSMVAWWLAFLPEWTTFALLILLIIFDIAVVLAPKGPLRVIVETAQQRREPLPAPVYHGHDIQLGLGDFIFYTVLVARGALAPSGGFLLSAAVVCLSIISGLGITLMVLAVTGRALPALPVSLFLGLIWYFFAVYLIAPFSVDLVVHQITM
jgi:presenilin 1